MKKEEFKNGSQKYYIDDDYVYENQEYILVISSNIFDEETVEYANRIVEKYKNEKNDILDHMLKVRLREIYSMRYSYSDEYIKNNIGKATITINFKKNEANPNWKFKYAGIIDFFESKLDEHLISIEFVDDLKLSNNVQLNG